MLQDKVGLGVNEVAEVALPQAPQLNAQKVSPYHLLLQMLLVIALLSGGFTLERVGIWDSPWYLNQIRFPIFAVYATAVYFWLVVFRPTLQSFTRLAVWWLLVTFTLFFYLFISISWARYIESTTILRLGDLVLLILIVLTTYLVFGVATNEAIDKLLLILVFVGILYFLGGVFTGNSIAGRMSAFGGGPNVFVRIQSIGFLSALYYFWHSGRLLWLVVAAPMLIGAVLSGSRGGILALAVSLIPLLLILMQRDVWKIVITIVSLVLGIGLTITLSDRFRAFAIDTVLNRYYEQTYLDGYASSRDILFQIALEMFSDYPLRGLGLNSFWLLSGTGQPYPHNLILELAVDGGLIALALFSALLMLLLFSFKYVLTFQSKLLLILAFNVFLASMFSGGIFDTRFMWLFLSLYLVSANSRGGNNSKFS